MRCPQCGTETPDEDWNCVSCRINLYWASRHYDDLAQIRERQGLRVPAQTPVFLRQAHEREMNDRIGRSGRIEHRVRQIARLAMRRQALAGDGPAEEGLGGEISGQRRSDRGQAWHWSGD
jgi:hypothetical protein